MFIDSAPRVYRVWQDGEEEDAIEISAQSQKEAARKWAKWHDEEEEHDIANGATIVVIVELMSEGQHPKWKIELSGEWVAQYQAKSVGSWSYIGGRCGRWLIRGQQ